MTQSTDGRIVPLAEKHIRDMAEIEKLCFSQPWSLETLENELVTPLARYFVFEYGGRVLGYIGTRMIYDECHITNVAVHPGARRHGIAKRLLSALEEFAANNGISLMTLEVRQSNTVARSFYEKSGFAAIGLRRGYYDLPPEDAVLMTKHLGGGDDKII